VVLRRQVRVLERQLHTRVRYRPADRAILAALGRLLPRDGWRSFLVTPDTLLRWHRNATKNKWRRWRKRRGPGRPPDATSWSNSSFGWGARTEAGGVSVSRASSESSGSAYRPRRSDGFCAELAWGPLHGVAPRGPSSFVSRLTACWPRTSSPWTRWRLKQLYVLFVIELSSREAHILGVTVHPKGAFVTQVARNLMGDLADRDRSVMFLIRDRDTNFTTSFDEVFRSEGIRVIKNPVRLPRANAFAERWVRTVRTECLDRMLILGRGHLERVLRECVGHYNRQRPHRGIDLGVPTPAGAIKTRFSLVSVIRRNVLGGLIHEYHPAAA
jgi:putative transposase